MLTAEILEEAQTYVIEKNRLHNRYLVGTGVVCGLAVRCDPCDGVVTVEPGYAIDCCGNDIVVCETERFDVLRYLKDCFRDEEPGCDGKLRTPPPSSCDDQPRDYCLVISYNEIHTRPMTAMVRQNGCSSTSCEPSQTNEVFRLDLVEEDEREQQKSKDDFWSKARECFVEYLSTSKKFFADFQQAVGVQNAEQRHQALKTSFCRLKDEVLRLYRKGARTRCSLLDALREIEDSFPLTTQAPQYGVHVYNAMFRLYAWLMQLMLDCICDALLVPCRPCGDEEGVRLACITVRNGKIEKICNLARRQLLTAPNLRYWMQPVFSGIHRLVEHICCDLDLARAFDGIFRPREEQTTTTVTNNMSDEQTETTFQGQQQQQQYQQQYQSPQDTAQSIEEMVMRGDRLMHLLSAYSASTANSLGMSNLLQLTTPQVYTALDVYGLKSAQATAKLEQRGYNVTERRVTEAEAYSLGNLFHMAWVLPTQETIELVIDPNDNVSAVNVQRGGSTT
jgi:hypothetical protein